MAINFDRTTLALDEVKLLGVSDIEEVPDTGGIHSGAHHPHRHVGQHARSRGQTNVHDEGQAGNYDAPARILDH